MAVSGSSPHPSDLYRCLVCGYEGLSQAQDRIYCPQCGQSYPLQNAQVADFVSPLVSNRSFRNKLSLPAISDWLRGYEHLWRPWLLSALTGETFEAPRERQLLQELVPPTGTILDISIAGRYWSHQLLTLQPQRQILGLVNQAVAPSETPPFASSPYRGPQLRAEVEHLPLSSACLAAVICGTTWRELFQRPTLQEIARVLSPGGVLITLQGQKQASPIPQILNSLGLPFYSHKELQQALQAYNFQIDRYLSFGPLALVRSVRR